MKKRILSLLLAMCILCGLLPTGGIWAAEEVQVDSVSMVPEIVNMMPELKDGLKLDKVNTDAYPLWDGSIATSFARGTGKSSDPYIIETAPQLAYFAKSVNSGTNYKGKYVTLANDILLNDIDNFVNWEKTPPKNIWAPIGTTTTNSFQGTFDGGDKKIYGVYVTGYSYAGLFGVLRNATVYNVNVSHALIQNGSYTGGIAACTYLDDGGKIYIDQCSFYGIVRSNTSRVGGISGYLYWPGILSLSSSQITGCTVMGRITGTSYVSGIGEAHTVDDCMVFADITGTGDCVGGILPSGGDKVSNCIMLGSVTGRDQVGGIKGSGVLKVITQCANYADITGRNEVGGILGYGYSYPDVLECYNTGKIYGEDQVGGIIGHVDVGGGAQNCYNTGIVEGKTSKDTIGGLVGHGEYNGGGAYESINVGLVKNGAPVIGTTWIGGSVSNCYYLKGSGSVSSSFGTALTAEKMKTIMSFSSLDFTETWEMNEYYGRPTLKNNKEMNIQEALAAFYAKHNEETISVYVNATNATTGEDEPVPGATVTMYKGAKPHATEETNDLGIATFSISDLSTADLQNMTISAKTVVSQGLGLEENDTNRNELYTYYPKDKNGDPYRYTLELHSEWIDSDGNWCGKKIPLSRHLELTLSEPRLLVNMSCCYLASDTQSKSEQYFNAIKTTLNEYANYLAKSTDGHVLIDKMLIYSTNSITDFYFQQVENAELASMADIQIQSTDSSDIRIQSNANPMGFWSGESFDVSGSLLGATNFPHQLKEMLAKGNSQRFCRIQTSAVSNSWEHSVISDAKEYSKALVHETGHYIFGLLDEYLDANGHPFGSIGKDKNGEVIWRAYDKPNDENYGLMDNCREGIELSKTATDYDDLPNGFDSEDKYHTAHSIEYKQSCEETLATFLISDKTIHHDNKYKSKYTYAHKGIDRTAAYSYASLESEDYLILPDATKRTLLTDVFDPSTSTYVKEPLISLAFSFVDGILSVEPMNEADVSCRFYYFTGEKCEEIDREGSRYVLPTNLDCCGELYVSAVVDESVVYNRYFVEVSESTNVGAIYEAMDGSTFAYTLTETENKFAFISDGSSYLNNEYISVNKATHVYGKGIASGEIYSVAACDASIDFATLSWFRYYDGEWTKLDTDISSEENLNIGARANLQGEGIYVLMAMPSSEEEAEPISELTATQDTDRDAVVKLSFADGNADSKFYNVYYSAEPFDSKDDEGVDTMTYSADRQEITLTLAGRESVGYVAIEVVTETGATSPLSEVIKVEAGAADSDGDGIPNWYCNEYLLWGTDGENKDIANSDDDGDGKTNLEEYLAGTHPNLVEPDRIEVIYVPELYYGQEDLINNIKIQLVNNNGTTERVFDFEVTGYDSSSLGTRIITVSYMGMETHIAVEVDPISVSETTCSSIPRQLYTGSDLPFEPEVTFVCNATGETLVYGKDYTVEYRDNVTPGTAQIIITGIGNYTGTRSVKFSIYCSHSYEQTGMTPSTCTATGRIYYTCTICGGGRTTSIALAPHTFVGDYCKDCGCKYSATFMDFRAGAPELGYKWSPGIGTGAPAFDTTGSGRMYGTLSGSEPGTLEVVMATNQSGFRHKVSDGAEVIQLRIKVEADVAIDSYTYGLSYETDLQTADEGNSTLTQLTAYSVRDAGNGFALLTFPLPEELEGQIIESLCISMLQGIAQDYTGSYDLDYIYIGREEYAPSMQGVFLDFTNTEADQAKYAGYPYGGYNYDIANWCFNKARNNKPVFDYNAGTLSFTMPAGGEDPYIQTSNATGGSKEKPLTYNPGDNDVLQIRLKIENCRAKEGKNAKLQLYVIKDNEGDVDANKVYVDLGDNMLNMTGFGTITIPLTEAFRDVDIVHALRVTFMHMVPANPETAKVTIDYIYVGPEENAPIDDHLYFGFESSPEDQERYSGKTYTNHNFDTGSWLVRRAHNEMYSATFENGNMTSVIENATTGCYFETGEKVTDNWLTYNPQSGDYVQARLKIESSNTENDTKSPIVYFIFSENGEQKVDSEGSGMSPATRIKLPKGSVNQGYQTVTIPLHPDTIAAYDIGSMRIAIEGVNYVPGDKITIDYIYVGQYDTLPSEVAKVVFSNEDGTTLYEHFVSPGEKTTYQGATPAKAADTQGHYVFDGTWKTASGETADLSTIAEPVTLYPSFHAEAHTGVLRNEIAPTCTAEGYSGDLYCETCDYLMESGTNVDSISHSYNEEGLCVCGKAQPIQEPTWKLGRSLNLASDISINFAVSKASLSGFDMDTVYVLSELDVYEGNVKTGVKTIEIRPEDKGNYYYFTLSGLTAVKMNDTIRSVLYGTKAGQEYCSAIDEYSIATYAYTQMNKASIPESLKVLCADLLRYGAKAQIFKGYRTDSLADANMTDEQKAYLSDLEAVEFNPTNTVLNDVPNAPMKWEGKALDLASKVTVKFIFSMGSYAGKVEDLTLKVSYEGIDGTTKTLTLQNGELYHSKYNFYAFTLDTLLAAELRSVLSVQIFEGETPVSSTLQYAAETYGNNKTGTLGELCKALFAYSDSAREFFK